MLLVVTQGVWLETTYATSCAVVFAPLGLNFGLWNPQGLCVSSPGTAVRGWEASLPPCLKAERASRELCLRFLMLHAPWAQLREQGLSCWNSALPRATLPNAGDWLCCGMTLPGSPEQSHVRWGR